MAAWMPDSKAAGVPQGGPASAPSTAQAPQGDLVSNQGKPGCALGDLCLACGGKLVPEHAHYRCSQCHQRDSCCF